MLPTLLGLLLASSPAPAGSLAQLDPAVHRALDEERGWRLHKEADERGVTIYAKEIGSLGLTAFKGVKVLDPAVDPAHMFEVVTDIEGQTRFAPLLLESRVVQQTGDSLAYYQVIEPPRMVPGSERYWITTGSIERAYRGRPGHYRRTWSTAPDGALPEVHADLAARYPKGVEVEISHGSWELEPQDDGTTLYTYRTVSHPGGAVPAGVARMLSSRTLPENMLNFEAAARR